MNKKYIDINCDVGEGIPVEESLFPYISSCNIACGGHYGTADSIKKTVDLAIKNDVKIGAHPSYPDKNNFGRVSINMPKDTFIKSIQEQMHNIDTVLGQKEKKLHHIKAHGALYNDLATDVALAKSFLEALGGYKDRAYLYAPYGSVIAVEAIKNGFLVQYEAFADRNYNSDLSLVSRKLEEAIIIEPKAVLMHLKRMCLEGKVATISGILVNIKANTYCVHGDTSSALDILEYISTELPTFNIYTK
ncbi:LamB/YcsF family protein [uncultured Maribacter sp.]|uniref:LamB/YcsF family protein n=1 Tax=uncultured Maribacter sp. TaxID=431308 RepID=UPI002614CB3A|nr:LamB/YcsF family protein [uncultured Maribacter sp.]